MSRRVAIRLRDSATLPGWTPRPFGSSGSLTAQASSIWRKCDLLRPWNDPDLDIDRKLAVDDSMFLIAESDTHVVGTVMAGYDGHRGWINYLAVDPARHGQSVGRLLMERAEQHLREIGCPKINLQIRSDNRSAADFYERLGYSTDEVVSMGKRLINDAAPDRERSTPRGSPPAGH